MKHSQWEESQKEMLSKLVTSGANKIWEHSLHDPVVKSNPKKYVQKPIYTDSLDDKRSYIRVSDFKRAVDIRLEVQISLDPAEKLP